MFTYISLCLPRAYIEKNNDIEKRIGNNAEKRLLGNVSLLTSIRNIFRKAFGFSSKSYKCK